MLALAERRTCRTLSTLTSLVYPREILDPSAPEHGKRFQAVGSDSLISSTRSESGKIIHLTGLVGHHSLARPCMEAVAENWVSGGLRLFFLLLASNYMGMGI